MPCHDTNCQRSYFLLYGLPLGVEPNFCHRGLSYYTHFINEMLPCNNQLVGVAIPSRPAGAATRFPCRATAGPCASHCQQLPAIASSSCSSSKRSRSSSNNTTGTTTPRNSSSCSRDNGLPWWIRTPSESELAQSESLEAELNNNLQAFGIKHLRR